MDRHVIVVITVRYRPSFFKHFNKLFYNSLSKSASWIDTAKNPGFQLLFMQTTFDINEIYVRQWRQSMVKKISHSTSLVNTQSQAISNSLARQEVYKEEVLRSFRDSNFPAVQKKWAAIIVRELNELKEFSVDKDEATVIGDMYIRKLF